MAGFHHGVEVIEVNDGARPIQTVSTAVVGIVATADDADAAVFPLNRPVMIAGNRTAMLAKAGQSGTLKRTLAAIYAQTLVPVIVVRAAQAATTAEQDASVIGTTTADGQMTGLKALLTAQAALGVTPRIIGAPGLDTQAVTTEIAAVCAQLRAFGYAAALGATPADAVLYRENFDSKRLMLLWPDFLGQDGNALPSAAVALGLRALLDNTAGWHKSISNTPANGVSGISKDVFFDLQATGTTADQLNAAEVTTLVRQDGFRLWGNRTCSTDPRFAFEVATRTGDIIADSIAQAQLWAMDRPMTKTLLADMVEMVNGKMRDWTANGYILGGEAWADPEKNTATALSAGNLHIDYSFTPVPPLENLTLTQSITDFYSSQLVK